MLTVTISINGRPIFTRSAVNRLAEVGYYVVDDGTLIAHDPDDGAVALAIQLLHTIRDQPDQVLRDLADRHELVAQEELTDEDYRRAKAALNYLVAGRIEHRLGGCMNWFCWTGDQAAQIDAFSRHQVQQILAVAVDRIAGPVIRLPLVEEPGADYDGRGEPVVAEEVDDRG